jgi:hypothetical protein
MNVETFMKMHEPKAPVFELNKAVSVPCFLWVVGEPPVSQGKVQLKKGTKLVRHRYSNYGDGHSMCRPHTSGRSFVIVKYADMDPA